jgi:hypothetical protein
MDDFGAGLDLHREARNDRSQSLAMIMEYHLGTNRTCDYSHSRFDLQPQFRTVV